MLVDPDRILGYRNSPIASEGAQGNLTPGADPNIHNLPESADDDDNLHFDGVIGAESAQRVSVKLAGLAGRVSHKGT